MRKQTLTILAVLFLKQIVAAQTVAPPPVGTRWTYHQSALYGQNGNFFTLDIAADSTIDGKICKKIVGGFGCAKLSASGIFVLFEGKKAYQFDPTRRRFWLLYDWSADVGDIVTVFVPRPETVDSFQIRIDSVTTWSPNGVPLRIQKITPLGVSRWLFASQQIIEKMGANAVFFPQSNTCDPIQFGSLRCYEEPNMTPVKFVGFRCDTVIVRVRTSDLFAERQITLTPNPSVSELNLTFDAPVDGGFEVEVLNLLKQVVWKTSRRQFASDMKIDVSHWQSGVYILNLKDKNGGQWSRQFVKMD